MLFRKRGEVLAGLDLLQHFGGLGARLLLGCFIGVLRKADEDVAGADPFGLLKLRGVLLVEVVDLLRRDGHLWRDFRLQHGADEDVVQRIAAELFDGDALL